MTYLKRALLALVMIVPLACTKPTENIKLVVDTNIIKYTALVNVTDANTGAIPSGATIKIGGDAAADIYEVSGSKNIALVNGVVAVGLTPAVAPTAAKPINFTITISAPGYNTVSAPVTFTEGDMQEVVSVSLSKTSTSTASTVKGTRPATSSSNPSVTLNFTGTCTNRSDVLVKPSLYIFYRVTGSGAAYQYLGYMTSGVINTTALAQGKSYDFQITYDGQNYTTTKLIQQTSYAVSINLGTACNNF